MALAVVAVAWLETSAAHAEDPCAEDVKQLCSEVQVGGGRVQDCLRKNEANLSPACKAKRAATDARFRGIVSELASVCQRDIGRLCGEVQPGHGRVVACLLRQQDHASSACHTMLDRYQTAADKVAAVRASCKLDVERLCADVPQEAGALVECLQRNRPSLSETCREVDPEAALAAAELVDAVETARTKEGLEEALQILQGIETIAFSRSQVLFQVDSFQGLTRSANAHRFLFNPQIVFGPHDEFAVQLKAPILAVYPYAPERSTRGGIGAIGTSVAWAFAGSKRVHQYLSAGLQWKSIAEPPVGAAWAVMPSYAISISLARWFSVTGQVAWIRSFASNGYPELDLLLFDPVLVVNLPGRSFVGLDTKLGWSFVDSSFLPVMKGILGIYIDRQRTLSVSAWYQAALTSEAIDQTFKVGVGVALAHFFDW